MKRSTQRPAGNDLRKVHSVAQHSAGNDSREASADTVRRAIGYIRVWTETQPAEGMSLDAQQAKISEYCAENGLRLITVCRDVASGSKNQRPGLQDALKHLERSADVLLVLRFDRLSRFIDHLCELYELLASIMLASSRMEERS